jgi:TP901 family phage tail tape measure protein
MGDVVKSVTIKYSQTGMAEMTRQVKTYNDQLGRVAIGTQKLNNDGAWTTIGATTKGVNTLSSSLNSVMMRFIGLNAIINMGTQAYQELREWIDASVVSFRSFEYKMAEVSSILDSTTRDTLPSLEVGISQLSVKFGKSVEDMSKGLYDIVSAAFSVEDAIGLLEVATKAAIAGVTTTTSAVKTLTGVLNAYGMSAAFAGEVSDKLFQAVIRGVFTFSDLEGAMGYVTPIAANLGVSLDEILSAMSAATRQGQHLDSITRGLGLMLQGIVDPTTQAADAARKYGIDMSATALRTSGLTGFLKQLSAATDKYGMQILPELIGNMRSLRVALALTGDTGLTGFSDDMDLMATSTGRTDDAMAAMMNTQKMLADILTQSMEKINRSIGEAWSGVDIWWKKSQLWWGTLFSGGDADKAVQDFDDTVFKIRQKYLDNLVLPSKKGEKTILDKLTEGITIKKGVPWEKIFEYNRTSKGMDLYAKMGTDAQNAITSIQQLQSLTNKRVYSTKAGYKQEIQSPTLGDFGVDQERINKLNDILGRLGIATISTSTSVKQLDKILGEVNKSATTTTTILESLIETESGLRPAIDQVKSAFESMKTQIDETELSIIMIKSEIEALNEQLNVPYKGFDNVLRYGIAVKEASNQLERFAEFSQMAQDQGPEYLNEFTNQFDQYGNSMNSVLRTIYEYNEAMDEQKKVTEASEKANKALQIAMAANNIEMLKLQLIGMMRRRGNSRAEQKQMKMIEIENTQFRIQEMENQYNADVANQSATLASRQTAYDDAQETLKNYVQFEQHQMWLLQDTRQEELIALQTNLTSQQTELVNKTASMGLEYKKLSAYQKLYTDSLTEISKNPEYKKAFEELTGINTTIAAQQAWLDYITFMHNNPVVEGLTTLSGLLGSSVGKVIPKLAEGTDYVPSTGVYQLHKGEAVIPAGQNSGGVTIGNISITIPVKTNASPQDIAKAVTIALDSQIMQYDSTGKLSSKYRRR